MVKQRNPIESGRVVCGTVFDKGSKVNKLGFGGLSSWLWASFKNRLATLCIVPSALGGLPPRHAKTARVGGPGLGDIG